MPSACASSSCTEMAIRSRHRTASTSSIAAAAGPDDPDIPGGDGENVAKQHIHVIAGDSARHQARLTTIPRPGRCARECRAAYPRQNAAGASAASAPAPPRSCRRQRRLRDVDIEQQAKPRPQQAGMGQRFAEIGHAAPDDEAADRARHQRNPRPARGRAGRTVRRECPASCAMQCLWS
jgi:hypothetical protein